MIAHSAVHGYDDWARRSWMKFLSVVASVLAPPLRPTPGGRWRCSVPRHGSSLPRIRISNDVANSEWQGSVICIAAWCRALLAECAGPRRVSHFATGSGAGVHGSTAQLPRTLGIWMNSQGDGIGPTGTSISVGPSRRANPRLSAARKAVRVSGAFGCRAETFGKANEIRIGEVAGDQAIAVLQLLDAPHIAECAVGENRPRPAGCDGGRRSQARSP